MVSFQLQSFSATICCFSLAAAKILDDALDRTDKQEKKLAAERQLLV